LNRTYLFHLPLLILLLPAVASSQENDTTYREERDSMYIPVIPLPLVGTIEKGLPPHTVIGDSESLFREYTSMDEIVIDRAGVFYRDLGSLGQHSSLVIQGADSRSIAYLHNGILLNEPLTGTYNSHWFQVGQMERLEFVTGPRAFLYGINSTGGVINIVDRSYKAIRPRTQIRYSESAYEQTIFDGTFSQNLTRNVNLTGGVQRLVTDGRYQNGNNDGWGARISARWDLTNRWNLVFSENYTRTQLGLFGGIDYKEANSALLFDRRQTQVVSSDAYEKVTRHDLQFTIAATPFDDSSQVSALTAYVTTHFRELRDENNRSGADAFYIFDDYHLRTRGVKLTQNLPLEMFSLNFGGELQSRQIVNAPGIGYRSDVATNAYGKLEVEPLGHIRLAGYARFDRLHDRTAFSFGTDASVFALDWIEFYGGYSQSSRFPTFQELYWRRGNISGPTAAFKNERHHVFEAGTRMGAWGVLKVDLRYFRRTIFDPIAVLSDTVYSPFVGIQFVNQDRHINEGISASAELRYWLIQADGTVNFLTRRAPGQVQTMSGPGIQRSNLQPEWWASGGVYLRGWFFDDNLDLKLGIRGRVWGEQQGMEFNPEAMMFAPSSLPSLGIATSADVLLIGKIGRAHVHFIWQNLFDNNYVVVPFYPITDRAVRFGITWEILD
jgi:outer membrane cobalamin receptor